MDMEEQQHEPQNRLLSILTLLKLPSFSDAGEEHSFQQYYARHSLSSIRLAAVITAVIILLFSRADTLSYGDQWTTPFSVRLAGPFLLCVLLFIATHSKLFLKHAQTYATLFLIGILISIYVLAIMISIGPASVMDHQIIMMNIILAWGIAGVGFNLLAKNTLVIVSIPSIVVIATIRRYHDIDQQYFEGYIASLVAIVLFTYAVSVQRENHVRRMFRLQSELEGKIFVGTEQLKEEMAERKDAEKQVQLHSNFDALTGLTNRELFPDLLSIALRRAEKDGYRIALLYFNLDRFKEINETLGHSLGDKLLKEASSRIVTSLRKTDVVARMGGDEFAAVITNIKELKNIEDVAVNVMQNISKPFNIDGNAAFITSSIGITVFPEDGSNTEILLSNAVSAMHQAKHFGKNSYQFFTKKMGIQAYSRRELEIALHDALANKEFFVCYQPIMNLATGTIESCEALIRWVHPKKGIISPADFIPLAEEIGLIEAIGEWVLREACREAASWPLIRGKPVSVAVNLSSRQFQRQNITELIESALKESTLTAERLTVEITEGLLLGDNESILQQLQELRKQGVNVAIDDFGTGYSSLSYLKKFPINILKIDQSFVSELPSSDEDTALVEAIIIMAKSLKLKVVAEGVETKQQADFLRAKNCSFAQGYLFSRPLKNTDFSSFLGQRA